MMRPALPLALLSAVLLHTGCGHSCDLDTDAAKKAFEDIAGMTKGAAHCFVSEGAVLDPSGSPSLELAAAHNDTTVEVVAAQYKSFLDTAGWETTLKAHEGKRANGKPYTGKALLAKKGDRHLGTVIYLLGQGLVDTTTMEVPKEKADEPGS